MDASEERRDERGMIASILGGETRLFHELIKPYERSAYLMALSFLRNEADAEDAVQEAFLKAFRHLASFRCESRFGTWVISIVLNEARSLLRRKNSAPMDSLDAEPEDPGHISPALMRDWREIPLQVLERQEMRLMMRRSLRNCRRTTATCFCCATWRSSVQRRRQSCCRSAPAL
jgi:RNA polymerase sigma-70 factor (ECF subfamily)